MINLVAVDGGDEKIAALLKYLQLECLAFDETYDSSKGHWWIAYDGALPVAFAGIVQSVQWCDTGYLCRAGVIPAYRGRGLQKRLIRVRERKARQIEWNYIVTDTSNDNVQSSNSLIACGFRLFTPSKPWGLAGANYWRKQIGKEADAREGK